MTQTTMIVVVVVVVVVERSDDLRMEFETQRNQVH
jgi:hypothetical protein